MEKTYRAAMRDLLEVDDRRKAIFATGHRVGELARTRVPGGVLIDLPHDKYNRRVAATRWRRFMGLPGVVAR